MPRIFYICNRQKDCNKSDRCGEECKATSDIRYAENFVEMQESIFVEKCIAFKHKFETIDNFVIYKARPDAKFCKGRTPHIEAADNFEYLADGIYAEKGCMTKLEDLKNGV